MTFTVKRKAPNPNGNPNFKQKWKTGNTIAIRIPEALADLVVSVARKIDSGELSKADVSQLCLEVVPEPTHEGARVSTRGNTQAIQELIDQFEENQRAIWGQSANQRGAFKNDSPRWAKHQEFKAWVADLIS